MVFLLGALLGLAAGLVAGGSIQNLTSIRFRWPLLVVAAVVVKELGVLSPLSRVGATAYLYAAGMLVLAAWTLWHLDRLPGVWLVTLGIVSNLAAVLANGAHMPVAPAALAHVTPAMAKALSAHGTLGQYVLAGPGTRLAWLDDWIPGPFGAAFSPGDALSLVGMAVLLFLLVRRRPQKSPAQAVDPERIVG